jgi:hypothetical protein
MTVKEELHELVEVLDDSHAREALDYLRWLAAAEDAVATEGEQPGNEGEVDGEGVEYLKFGRPTSTADSLWNIVGIGRSDEPTDVATCKDEYLAEAYAPTKP